MLIREGERIRSLSFAFYVYIHENKNPPVTLDSSVFNKKPTRMPCTGTRIT